MLNQQRSKDGDKLLLQRDRHEPLRHLHLACILFAGLSDLPCPDRYRRAPCLAHFRAIRRGGRCMVGREERHFMHCLRERQGMEGQERQSTLGPARAPYHFHPYLRRGRRGQIGGRSGRHGGRADRADVPGGVISAMGLTIYHFRRTEMVRGEEDVRQH